MLLAITILKDKQIKEKFISYIIQVFLGKYVKILCISKEIKSSH